MAELSEEEFVNQYFYGNAEGILDVDIPTDNIPDYEDADIITVYLSEADIDEIENIEMEDDIISDDCDMVDNELTDCNVEVLEFIRTTCSCSEKCSSKFDRKAIVQSRNDFQAFDFEKHGRNQLDIVMLGIIHALALSDSVVKRERRMVLSERRRPKLLYLFHGREVCEDFFLFVHGIGIKRFRDLLTRYKQNNTAIREQIQVNCEKSSINTIPPYEHLVNFIRNYSEDRALYFPRRVSSRKRILKLLPSDEAKSRIFFKYKTAAEKINDTPVDINKFSDVWLAFCSDIIIQRAKSETIRAQRRRMKKQLEKLKSEENPEDLECQQSHLQMVQSEIKHYHSIITETREKFPFGKFDLPKPILSFDGSVHLSFDFAQQVHIPSNPLKPDPMYFLVPYRVRIFGVMNDTCRRQCNYIIPEAITFEKRHAANCIISYLHHYLQKFTFGETELKLHGGDCIADNKNNLTMQYLAWRIAQKLNKKITISFLPTGHTRFGPDYAFGLFKIKLRESVISCLNDVVDVVNLSTPDSHLNFSFLVGEESGRLLMDMYDWQIGFSDASFFKIPDIIKYSHFHFDENWIGKVKCQKHLHGEMRTFPLFDSTSNIDVSTINFEKIIPEGLSYQRKLYLYEKIRPYCSELIKDILCPIPLTDLKNTKKRKLKSQ